MIKNPLLFALSGIILVVTVGLFCWRAAFWLSSVETQGTVVSIDAFDMQCGGKHKHPCTTFQATLEYEVDGVEHHTRAAAGEASGYHQSIKKASHHVGEHVPVLYSPLDPDNACRNSLFDVWGAPVMSLMVQIMTMVGSLFEGKRRR